ncbi:MAG: D-aminoacylase [Nitrospirae bacterium]|nr:D-aminoacylase [Nitrospirota bacterium]
MIDCLIRGGIVIDGTGSEPRVANVGIEDGRIVHVGSDETDARDVLDVKGLTVAPGFIDAHAHSEFTILADGRAEGKLFQGVTTEINGNCGLSAAPLHGEAAERREEDLRELGIGSRWSTLSEYLSLLEARGTAINFATLCGHGNIRASVLGYRDVPPDAAALSEMRKILTDSLREGAVGLSTGLIYPPGLYADTRELIELSRVLSREGRGGIYTSHMRSEGDALLESVEEVLCIAREAGVRVHVSHIKTAGRHNWGKIDRVVELMDAARKEGISLTCDRYPYVAAATDLDTVLPSWVYEGGVEEELGRLRDPAAVARIRSELGSRGDDYWGGVYVSSVSGDENRWMEGRNILDISSRMKKSPVDAVIEIVMDERARAGAVFFSMSEDNLRRFLRLPYTMIGSDSSARSMSGPTRSGNPHPRGFGAFARFLGRYVRDEGLMSLSEAIWKMTCLPAVTFGLKERGLIREGYHADIVIFDYERITDAATFEEPWRRAEGVVHVFVNGVPALRDSEPTGALPGMVLR